MAEKAAPQLVLDNVCPILYIFVVFLPHLEVFGTKRKGLLRATKACK